MTTAAKQSGISRKAAYAACERSPTFKAECAEAKEEALDLLEQELLRRAEVGVNEPVYYKGEVVGEIRKYSDVLGMFMLKAGRPAKYRENIRVDGQLDITAPERFVVEVVVPAITEPAKALEPGDVAEE